MESKGILAAYHGGFNQAVINMLLRQARLDMQKRNIERRVFKKTYSILVECLENILKHTVTTTEIQKDGIVVLSTDQTTIKIMVGNLIKKEEQEILEKKISYVNSLDQEALKKAHLERLLEGEISTKGGAGLGIIEIAMKSKNKIDCFFSDYCDNLVFFGLQTTISNT